MWNVIFDFTNPFNSQIVALQQVDLIITKIGLSLFVFISIYGWVCCPLPQNIVSSELYLKCHTRHHSFDWREAPFLFFFCILYSNCLLNFNLCTKCMLLSGECSFEQLSVLLILVCDAFWPSVDILPLFHKEQRPSVAEYLHFILHSSTGHQHLFIALHNVMQRYDWKAQRKNSTVQYV